MTQGSPPLDPHARASASGAVVPGCGRELAVTWILAMHLASRRWWGNPWPPYKVGLSQIPGHYGNHRLQAAKRQEPGATESPKSPLSPHCPR